MKLAVFLVPRVPVCFDLFMHYAVYNKRDQEEPQEVLRQSMNAAKTATLG